jgi:hypothetical protein
MTQTDLNRVVARATGETVLTITQRGFGVARFGPLRVEDDLPVSPPQIVDWDELNQQRGWCLP